MRSARPHASASGDKEPRIHANGREFFPRPSAAPSPPADASSCPSRRFVLFVDDASPQGFAPHPQPSAALSPRADASFCPSRRFVLFVDDASPQGFAPSARCFSVGRRGTANPRERTRIFPQPAGLCTSPPAFGRPLSARGEGERGGEVGMPVRVAEHRAGTTHASPLPQPRRAGWAVPSGGAARP